jgi:hypothetical protein
LAVYDAKIVRHPMVARGYLVVTVTVPVVMMVMDIMAMVVADMEAGTVVVLMEAAGDMVGIKFQRLSRRQIL